MTDRSEDGEGTEPLRTTDGEATAQRPAARKGRKAVAARRKPGRGPLVPKSAPLHSEQVEGVSGDSHEQTTRRPVARRAGGKAKVAGKPRKDAVSGARKSAKKAAASEAPELLEPGSLEAHAAGRVTSAEEVERRGMDAARGEDTTSEAQTVGRPLRASYHAGPVPDHAQEGAVLITGICGRMGHLLTRILHRDDRVVGVDRRPFDERPKDVVHHQVDVRRKKTRDIFRAGGIRAVVHLGVMHNPRASERDHHTWNVVAFQKLLEYIAQYGVSKLVVLSSANAYGPMPDNPQFLTEESPLLGAQVFRDMRDLIELDMLAQSFFWRHQDTETVILRPCHILGRVRNAPSNYLRLERPVMLLGYDPMIQVIHERDVVRAIQCSLQPGIRGIFNLRGQGEIALSRVIGMAGKTPRRIPSMLAEMSVDRLWKYRMSTFPSAQLDYVKYVCMVDDTRAREVLGFEPKYTLDEAVAAVTADR